MVCSFVSLVVKDVFELVGLLLRRLRKFVVRKNDEEEDESWL